MDAHELTLLKELGTHLGYRFEIDRRGVERGYRPDGTLVFEHVPAEVPTLPLERPEGMPEDVTYQANGGAYRLIDTFYAPVCEACWQVIPHYADFPGGLVSPESDGDGSGNGPIKSQVVNIGESGKRGVMIVAKNLCLPCYLAAFSRVYPDAPLPALSDAVRAQPRTPAPEPIDAGYHG